MKICREAGANLGKAAYGTSTISVQGAVPAALTGVVGGGVQWLDENRIIYQSGGVGGVGPWILQSCTIPGGVTATQSATGMNFMAAGGGNWAKFLAGSGVTTNVGGLGPFPNGAVATVSAEGQVVIIESQQLGQGLTVYNSSGTQIFRLGDVRLASKEVRLVNNIMAYQDQFGWHLVDVTTGSTPGWFPRADEVLLLVPFILGGRIYVMEVFNKVTVRRADKPDAYVITDEPIFFSPDAIALSAGVARIGFCTNQGESTDSLQLYDLTVATGANDKGVVSGSTVVFTPQSAIRPSTVPLGPGEGGALANQRVPPVNHPVVDPKSGGRMTVPWQAWCQNIAGDAFNTGTAAGNQPSPTPAGPSFGAVVAGSEPIVSASTTGDLLTLTSSDGSIVYTSNPASKSIDLSAGSSTPTGAWVPVTDGDPVDPQIVFDAAGQVVVTLVPV
jgi:hypothetical protein